MELKKSLKTFRTKRGQSFLEYVLLAAISLAAIGVISGSVDRVKGAFEDHFNAARGYITGS